MINKTFPIKVLQFGEGNFLRAFVDWMIQKTNDAEKTNIGVAIVQPLAQGLTDKLKAQDCQYNVILEGIKNGEPIREIQKINCVQDALNPYAEYETYTQYFLSPDLEFVISNTTEAGIARVDNEDIFAKPPASFPGKMVALLYQRFQQFNGAHDKGLTIIACELIENNASTLKEIVLELAGQNQLETAFIDWINSACSFCNSLVDRIVTGFPKDNIKAIQQELGEKDNMVVTAEYFHLWAIEGNEATKAKFPLHEAGLNVLWLEDLKPFRDKKVRVLNGAHTALVPVGLLAGHQTVKQAFGDAAIENFIRRMIAEEVLPNIAGNKDELHKFADEILERFLNPYIKHYLKDISLNSISKWVTRDYPSLNDRFERTGELPKRLTFSLAALLCLYGFVEVEGFTPVDTSEHLVFIQDLLKTDSSLGNKVAQILSNKKLWGLDLTAMVGLSEKVTEGILRIQKNGIQQTLAQL